MGGIQMMVVAFAALGLYIWMIWHFAFGAAPEPEEGRPQDSFWGCLALYGLLSLPRLILPIAAILVAVAALKYLTH